MILKIGSTDSVSGTRRRVNEISEDDSEAQDRFRCDAQRNVCHLGVVGPLDPVLWLVASIYE